jgi:sterol desaturase/sphingolipid hydroxylase (fatty acid hydroxylase superfamily)
MQLAHAALSLAVMLLVFGPLEQLFAVRRQRFFYPGWAGNLAWYFVNAIIPALLLVPPAAAIGWAVHTMLPYSITHATVSWPFWVRLLCGMVVGEIGFYWGHRWCHELPLLWRFHAVHHSAEHMSFLVNTRAHPFDMVFTRLCGMVLLTATGLTTTTGSQPSLLMAVVLLISTMWSYFIHANLRWRFGPLEWLLSTPFFHHWHHTLEDHKDHNYASMLPMMDRLFGTLYLPKAWPAEYGTDTKVPGSVAGQLVMPFQTDLGAVARS